MSSLSNKRWSDAGAEVEQIGPLITDDMLHGLDRFWRTRSLRDLRRLPPENQERMLPYLREWMDAAQGRTGMELFEDFSQLEAISMAARCPRDLAGLRDRECLRGQRGRLVRPDHDLAAESVEPALSGGQERA